jgi:hypothetical protein
MPRRAAPLLCELHAHTTFSDGSLSRAELVDPTASAHAVAVGVREWIELDDGLDAALCTARASGAALIGAHPYTLEGSASAPRTTARFATEREWAAASLDRFELCNRHDFFPWVAEERLPVVACGDFHRPEHLSTWKTLLPCAREEGAVLDYLRSDRPVSLVRFEADGAAAGAARAA